MKKQLPRILGLLQIFVGVGAITGGLPLIFSPAGISSGMSSDILLNSPFKNFLIPGILLVIIFGIGNLIGSYYSLKERNKPAAYLGSVLGIGLIIWISVQVYYLGLSNPLQYIFFVIGAVQLGIGLRLYKRIRSI